MLMMRTPEILLVEWTQEPNIFSESNAREQFHGLLSMTRLTTALIHCCSPLRSKIFLLASVTAIAVNHDGLLKAQTIDMSPQKQMMHQTAVNASNQTHKAKLSAERTTVATHLAAKLNATARDKQQLQVESRTTNADMAPQELHDIEESQINILLSKDSTSGDANRSLSNCKAGQTPSTLNSHQSTWCTENTSDTISQTKATIQQAQAQSKSNIQDTINKIKANANPAWGKANKTGYFINLEQSGAWSFPSIGAQWGSGAGRGVTSMSFGINGSVNGNSPNMFNWSAQIGPIFEHIYNVPGVDRTALSIGIYGSLNPLRHFRNGFNLYTTWNGIIGLDQQGSSRVQNVLQAGMIYSFANVNIIPDPVQRINIPEKGIYLRVQPTWLFALDGQLAQSRTQAYLGWAENFYPFSLAIEAGPEFIQSNGRELQTIIGSLFDLGYYFTPKLRTYVRYRPALSFGGSDYPAAPQVAAAGMAFRF